mgnify:FL=1
MKQSSGRIIIEPGVDNVLPWEMHSAIAIKKLGYTVRFMPRHNSFRSADAYINSTLFEFKSPEGTTIKCVENNLQNALRHQSKSVVIDSLRVKNVRDRSIQNYLINRMSIKKGIKNLIFVTKTGRAIDIGKSD